MPEGRLSPGESMVYVRGVGWVWAGGRLGDGRAKKQHLAAVCGGGDAAHGWGDGVLVEEMQLWKST